MPGLPPGVELSSWMLLKTQTLNHIPAKNGHRQAILYSHHLHPFLVGLPCGVHPAKCLHHRRIFSRFDKSPSLSQCDRRAA
jgi:hypothetical protein